MGNKLLTCKIGAGINLEPNDEGGSELGCPSAGLGFKYLLLLTDAAWGTVGGGR